MCTLPLSIPFTDSLKSKGDLDQPDGRSEWLLSAEHKSVKGLLPFLTCFVVFGCLGSSRTNSGCALCHGKESTHVRHASA